MRLDEKQQELEHEFLSDQTKAVPKRIQQLTPSFSFEELWQLHQQTDRSNSKNGQARKSVQRKWVLALQAAVLGTVLLFGGSLISPAIGTALKKIRFIELLYEKAGEKGSIFNNGLSQIEQKQLSTSTDLSMTDKEIKFTVADIFYDGIQIVISYEVEFLNKKEKIDEQDAAVYIDYGIEGAQPTMMSTHQFTITGDHSFVGTTVINTAPLPEHPKLNLLVSRIGNTNGNWNVSVPLSEDKTSPLTLTFRPQISASYENKSFTVDQIIATPVTTQLVIKTAYTGELSYTLKDDLEIPFEHGGGMGGDGEEHLNFSPPSAINPKPRYVTLLVKESQPGTTIVNQRNIYADYTDVFPITLEGYRGGKVSITDVQFLTDTIVVYYESSDAANQIPFLLLEDASGKRYTPKKNPVRISRDTFSYKMEFPILEAQSGIKFLTVINEYNAEPKKPLEIQIPLDWGNPIAPAR
jgi:hypothetical protein